MTKYPEVTLETIREAVITIRRQKLPDPEVLGNAGSFFMNPVIPNEKFEELQVSYPTMPHYPASETEVKVPAGWLIEQCGWKGRMVGNVGVHSRQALVIINLGGATGQEVAGLAAQIRENVYQQFGIDITPEVNYI